MIEFANGAMEFVNTWGPLGLMGLMVIGMVKGMIVPRKTVDELMKAAKESSEQSSVIMAKEVTDGVAISVGAAVERGIVRAVLKIDEINGGSSS